MLDTDLCVRVLRDRPAGLLSRFNAESDGSRMSSITFAELVHGAGKSARPLENRIEVDRLTARVGVLALDDRAAAHCAQIRANLERRGVPIGAYDLLIAGHGRSEDLIIVTANLRDFNRVEGLCAEDWLST
jgi:tRNA(fMet)-specific endonuclease VapC